MISQTQSGYFKQKNTKRGMALSTAMAISIVLAILVALFVSMATLNITTTQATVSQRTAYIRAKSAIAFAESYYGKDSDGANLPDISGTSGGKELMTFTSDAKDGAVLYDSWDDEDTVAKDNDDVTTYIEVERTSSYLFLTAYSKYEDGNEYKLIKEFDLRTGSDSSISDNAFTGNILYTAESGVKYLRIHVRTSAAFNYEPYLYTWGYEMNNSSSSKYGSSIVNKLADASGVTSHHFSGDWNGSSDILDDGDILGPQGAMDYEGNGWYVYTITFTTENISTINAIVARKEAVRTDGLESQTYEIFGIPVPTEYGEANGVDVYFTLNGNTLQDAQNKDAWHNDGNYGADLVNGGVKRTDSGDTNDDLSYAYLSCGSDPTKFAQVSSQYYSIYTKRDETYTIHIRNCEMITDDSSSSGRALGFTYEGYGWYRNTSYSGSDSITVNGTTVYYGSGGDDAIVSQNQYGKEKVSEIYVCVNGTNVVVCTSEADANSQFIAWDDKKAADYVTVYAIGDNQSVTDVNNPEITYTYNEWGDTDSPNAPDTDSDLTLSTDSDSDTETADTPEFSYDYYVISNIFNDIGMELDDESGNYTVTYYSLVPGIYKVSVRDTDNSLASDVIKVQVDTLSDVTFTFNVSEKKITYSIKKYTKQDTVSAWTYVGFYNSNFSNFSSYTTAFEENGWDEVYVTYVLGTTTNSYKLDAWSTEDASDDTYKYIVWGKVPEKADSIYFSNMPSSRSGESGFERTETITAGSNETIWKSNPVFFALTQNSSDEWTVGDNADFRTYTTPLISKDDDGNLLTGTATMAYTGSNQVAYYDIPIVNLLEALVRGSGNYVFSAYLWPSGYGFDGTQYYFDAANSVVYQGETFYYAEASGLSKSILIINVGEKDSDGNTKSAVLWEDMFALSSKGHSNGEVHTDFDVDMDNRAGATWTSIGEYYDGESDYVYSTTDGYVPSWYVYKIPAATQYSIGDVTNMDGNTTKNFKISDMPVVESKDTNLNQAIYLTYDSSNSSQQKGIYTYNTDEGKVDTTSDEKVYVYFEDAENWVSTTGGKIKCYAYGLETNKDTEINIDGTDTGTNYYRFEMYAGAYAYFIFYCDKDEDGNTVDVSSATLKTSILYLTGSENDDNEYQILARGSATEFEYYLHPKTKALYAYQQLRSAANEATSLSDGMQEAIAKMLRYAKSYYGSGSWSSSGSADYTDFASAVRELASAVRSAEVYISGGLVGAVEYTTAWKEQLEAVCTEVKDSFSSTNAQDVLNKASEINWWINNPQYTFSDDAATIIIDNNTDDDGYGGWTKSNINLYYRVNGTASWVNSNEVLYETTESGYYAYVLDFNTTYTEAAGYEFVIINGTMASADIDVAIANDDTMIVAESGISKNTDWKYRTRYARTYDTAADETVVSPWVVDNSIPTHEVTEETVDEDDTSTKYYGSHISVRSGKSFYLYFKYDTTIKYNSGTSIYVIPAGFYLISSVSYSGFYSDITGASGINLFSDTAKDFFNTAVASDMGIVSDDASKTNLEYYAGVTFGSLSSSYTTSSGSTLLSDGTISSSVMATASAGWVHLRIANTKSAGTLTINDSVTLTGKRGVSIAANKIVLGSSGSLIINSNTVTFYTDVVVYDSSDSELYKIQHGTYTFSGSVLSGSSGYIDLSDGTWTDKYIINSSYSSSLGGGTYVTE